MKAIRPKLQEEVGFKKSLTDRRTDRQTDGRRTQSDGKSPS